jgi:hypothetical protein
VGEARADIAPGIVAVKGLRAHAARAGVVEVACWLLIAVAIALVGFFDVQSNVTMVDEYARRWTIEQLVAGRGIQLWGTSPNLVLAARRAAIPGARSSVHGPACCPAGRQPNMGHNQRRGGCL